MCMGKLWLLDFYEHDQVLAIEHACELVLDVIIAAHARTRLIVITNVPSRNETELPPHRNIVRSLVGDRPALLTLIQPDQPLQWAWS